jgi:elongation factor Ts
MSVTAETVRQLRERTGAGMMECKKALVETAGDLDAAAELMRKQGLAKADKKASRVAAEGAIAIARSADGRAAAMVEVNSETDFVARGDDFCGFVAEVAGAALALGAAGLEPLLAAPLAGGSVDERQRALVAKIGEKISVRRHAKLGSAGHLGAYLHGTRIGALVAIEGGDAALAHDLAMHVAASNPRYLSQAQVPAAELERERAILTEQAQGDPKNQGKPPQVLAKIIDGKLAKGLAEITLLGQPFVKDPDQTVEKLLKSRGATVQAFERFEVGAGIEKKQENFAAEVMAQVSAAGRA